MTIQLYDFWRSNAAFRVRVALAIKGMPFESIEIDLLAGQQFDDTYSEVNPEHVVPTLIHTGNRFSQSLAIIEYLESLEPHPRLVPLDAKERAYAQSLALVSIADSHPLSAPRVRKHLGRTFGADAATVEAWCRHWTLEGVAAYERLLAKRPATPFALGERPTIADICIVRQIVLAELYDAKLTTFPNVIALGERCFALPAFAEAHPISPARLHRPLKTRALRRQCSAPDQDVCARFRSDLATRATSVSGGSGERTDRQTIQSRARIVIRSRKIKCRGLHFRSLMRSISEHLPAPLLKLIDIRWPII